MVRNEPVQYAVETVEDEPTPLERLLAKATNPDAEFLDYLVNERGQLYDCGD
jgi:hypothetical protein